MNNTFKKEDFNSPDGMLTSVWGPSLWHSLHAISFNYPIKPCLLYTSPSPRDAHESRMPSSA